MSRPNWHHIPVDAEEHATILDAVTEPGCLVCHRSALAESQWYSGFINEAHSEPDVFDDIASGGGFCTAHFRGLLLDPAASWILPAIECAVIGTMLHALTDDHAARQVAAQRHCRVCASAASTEQLWLHRLRAGLHIADVADRFRRSDGLCLRHGWALVADAPDVGDIVVPLLITSLSDPTRRATTLTGQRADHARRAHWDGAVISFFRELRAAAGQGTGSVIALLSEEDVCAACAQAEAIVCGYLTWASAAHDDATLADRFLPALCPTHVADCVRLGSERFELMAAAIAASWGAVLTRWMEGAPQPATNLAEMPCPACAAAAIGEHDALRLWASARDLPRNRQLQDGSTGLCALHAITVGGELAATCRAELVLLDSELTVQLRRTRWDHRWEGHGAEATAWYRALRQLNNAATRGRPPATVVEQQAAPS